MRDAALYQFDQAGRDVVRALAELPGDGAVGADPEALKRAIEHAVMSVFRVSRDELWYTSRGVARVALARQTAMYLAHCAGGLSLTEVGVLFNRDRTTVAHACAVVEDRRDEPNFDRAIELLERAVVALLARPYRRHTLEA